MNINLSNLPNKIHTIPAFKQKAEPASCQSHCEDTFCSVNDSEFKKKKNEILEKLKDNKLVDKNNLKQLAQSDNKEDFEQILEYIAEDAEEYSDNLLLSCIDWAKSVRNNKTTLAQEKLLTKARNEHYSQLISLFKTLSQKDENPDVLKIKSELIQNYGIKNVCLDNNLDSAKLFLEAMKVLKEKDFPLPQQIIMSKYLPMNGISMIADNKTTIMLNPEDISDTYGGSTDSPLHCIVHEAVHCTQLNLLAFNIKKIPKKYQNTVEKLSFYAEGNYAKEIHAELMTKKLLEELTPDEEELLKYIEGSL